MLQEIKIKNFLSFKDEVTFSFVATSDQFAEDSQVVKIDENTRLLRFAVVYGYNASGKSNLLSVLQYLSFFWTLKPKDMDSGTDVVPFQLDAISADNPSCFELVFFVENTKYWYQLELDSHQVYLEKLSYYKESLPIMLFERKFENEQSDILFNIDEEEISDTAKDLIKANCLKNVSFFAARNQVNVSLPLIDAAKNWMRNKLMGVITPGTSLDGYALSQTSKDSELTNYILDFLHEADFNITAISPEFVDKKILIPSEKQNEYTERTVKVDHTTFDHTVENDSGKETYKLDKHSESTGTLRTLGIETAVYNALKNDAILPIDEIETSLHSKLLEKFLFEYLKVHSKSQMIVTTHNDGLLDLVDDLLRKDSVWFTEKKKSGVSDLYRLTDFKGINRLSSIREAYRNKRFGATMG